MRVSEGKKNFFSIFELLKNTTCYYFEKKNHLIVKAFIIDLIIEVIFSLSLTHYIFY